MFRYIIYKYIFRNLRDSLQEDSCNQYRYGIIYVYMHGRPGSLKYGFAGIKIIPEDEPPPGSKHVHVDDIAKN